MGQSLFKANPEDHVTECGLCEVRNYCPIFLISVKNRVIKLLEECHQNYDLALAKALVRKNEKPSYESNCVVNYLKAKRANTIVPTNNEKGSNYLHNLLLDDSGNMMVMEIIAQEEKLEAEH